MSDSRFFRIKRPAKLAYRVGLGPVIGRIVLLLTTTGRKSGLARVTPLQYEIIDGQYYLASARGLRADWVRNIQANPAVTVRVKRQQFTGTALVDTNLDRITDFLEYRLARHPRMVGAIMKADGIPVPPRRADLEAYAAGLALVIITPDDTKDGAA